MTLPSATRLGTYEIVGPLAAGGMGEVYRARDPRLQRDVAVKIVHDSLVADPEALQRLEREARAAAALNHPNILTVHEIGEHGGHPYIVSELLEGQTLREVLTRGPLPRARALEYARQVSDGLAAAHQKGIVHRDLKPENLFVTTEGRIKILDFGIAKIPDVAVTAAVSTATTQPALKTSPGALVGTVDYMSPEQVRGQPVDCRSDIFSFGTVLCEMLTGARPFTGSTPADTIASILGTDPVDLLATLDVPLRRVVEPCLAKSPADRWQSATDLHRQLVWAGDLNPGVEAILRPRRGWIGAVALLAVLAAAAMIAVSRWPRGSEPGTLRLSVVPPPDAFAVGGDSAMALALSPDGQMLAFVGFDVNGQSSVWLRPLDGAPHRVAGSDGATYPFWAPDGRRLAFFAGGKLKTVDPLQEGAAQVECLASEPRGGSWGRQGVLIGSASDGLYRCDPVTNATSRLTTLDTPRGDSSDRWPSFLPDGDRYVYLHRSSDPASAGVYLASLEDPHGRRVLAADSSAMYVAPGWLLHAQGTSLVASPFDPSRTESVAGQGVALGTVWMDGPPGFAPFSASHADRLAYISDAAVPTQLRMFDRTGRLLSDIGAPADYLSVAVSAAGDVLVDPLDPAAGFRDVWVFRGTSQSRLTFGPEMHRFPVWAPGGTGVLFSANRNGMAEVFEKAADGSEQERLVFASSAMKFPTDASSDGVLVYQAVGPQTGWDIWAHYANGSVRPLVRTVSDEIQGQLSRDGRWIAYTSNESGRLQVYVQPVPSTGAKWQVSRDGGWAPRWRADGKELFFLSGHALMAAEVRSSGVFSASTPHKLFDVSTRPAAAPFPIPYGIDPQGNRFVVGTVTPSAPDIKVIVGWTAALPK